MFKNLPHNWKKIILEAVKEGELSQEEADIFFDFIDMQEKEIKPRELNLLKQLNIAKALKAFKDTAEGKETIKALKRGINLK